jgi:hypothetical protein
MPFLAGASNNFVNGPGSVLCLEFGTDIGLKQLEAAGIDGTYQLQFNVDMVNRSPNAINPSLYAVVVNEGLFAIEDNRSVSQIGVISRDDVLNSVASNEVDYHALENMAGTGNFLGDVKRVLGNVFKGAKKVCDVVEKIDKAKGRYGMGGTLLQGGMEDYEMMGGGRKMSRAELRNRLRKMYSKNIKYK